MNSVEEGRRAVTVPAAMAASLPALKRRTYSLNDATSSSFVIDCSGVKRPVPVNASAGTPIPLIFLEQSLNH